MAKTEEEVKKKCGIIMPISSIDGCDEAHWTEVRSILHETIESADFEPNLVSDADDVGIIQKRIIQNIYENPIVVCDVSGKNPNVMFELGMRLAFDKPTVIIKDDATPYSFDTSQIEHMEYPRDLRFPSIVSFKKELKKKIIATHKRATEDPDYTTFLGHFGTFTVAKLDSKEVSKEDFIISEMQEIKKMILQQESRGAKGFGASSLGSYPPTGVRGIGLKHFLISDKELEETRKAIDRITKNILKAAANGPDNIDLHSSDFKEWVFAKLTSDKSFKKYMENSEFVEVLFNRIFQRHLTDATPPQHS